MEGEDEVEECREGNLNLNSAIKLFRKGVGFDSQHIQIYIFLLIIPFEYSYSLFDQYKDIVMNRKFIFLFSVYDIVCIFIIIKFVDFYRRLRSLFIFLSRICSYESWNKSGIQMRLHFCLDEDGL